MNSLLKKFVGLLLSLKTTVVCLFLLLLLVFFGTLYQVEFGLHAAQQRFFYSWGLLLGGWIPMPGGNTVMWILFLNLLASMLVHFQFGPRHWGIVAIHFGILLLLVGGWFTYLFGEESFLLLSEGEASNVTSSYREWELSVWPDSEDGRLREVEAYDIGKLRVGDRLSFPAAGLELSVEQIFSNARAFRDPNAVTGAPPSNVHGITTLQSAPAEKEPESNMPGMIVRAGNEEDQASAVLLFGGDRQATRLTVGDTALNLQLRRKRYPLPLLMELLDFEKSFHPASRIPRAFSSKIRVYLKDLERDALIEMNKPFRYQAYTFFQASYVDTDPGAPEISRFAVTRNVGRLIPYVSTGVTAAGLMLHFILALQRPKSRKRKEA